MFIRKIGNQYSGDDHGGTEDHDARQHIAYEEVTENAREHRLHGIDECRVARANQPYTDGVAHDGDEDADHRQQKHHADLIWLRDKERFAADKAADEVRRGSGQHDVPIIAGSMPSVPKR